jgi:hypothetical protein
MFLLGIATLFVVANLTFPASSTTQSSSLEFAEIVSPETTTLIAQDTSQNSRLYFTTPTYVVSVHPRGTGPARMNVYNRITNQSLIFEQPALYLGPLGNDGFVGYESLGSINLDNVRFVASANRRTRQARIEVFDSIDERIISENATSITSIDVPFGGTGQDDLFDRTILFFETPAHAVRVFRGNGNTRQMNVFNKITGATPVNGQPATLVNPSVAPYENWVSYYGGSDFNGIPARYYARVNSRGEAILEAISNQGSVLFSEQRVRTVPMIVNIPPEDIPTGVDDPATSVDLSPYIAAVFGDQSTLEQLRRLYNSPQAPRTFGGQPLQEPYFESARQGRFINAGSFDNRDQAASVVSYLRSQGFNARLVFRDFRYR